MKYSAFIAASAALVVDFFSSAAVAQGREAVLQRVIYVCDASVATKRAWEREHGAQVFVTAEQATAAGGWESPRCMTEREARRLKQMRSAREAKTIQLTAVR